MRVTAETKARTRQRILDSAAALFITRGFEATTTRQIAGAAGVAVGTLFNYFPGKEALAMTLVVEAAEAGRQRWRRDDRRHDQPGARLDERLFGLIAAEVRQLRSFRPYLAEVLDAAASPFARSGGSGGSGEGRGGAGAGDAFRTTHLETVVDLLVESGQAAPSFTTMHLYWTLYLGVLAYWTHDDSHHQESTLGVLDQSLRLFVASLPDETDRRREGGSP